MPPANPPNFQSIERGLDAIARALITRGVPAYDGWSYTTDTWAYASATTITVPAGGSLLFSVGDKIKITQSGSIKYFFVVSLTDTVLTVTGGSDYSVANATIEQPAWSKAETPIGFPSYFNWLPTFVNFSLGNGTLIAKFTMKGKQVSGFYKVIFGSSTTIASGSTWTLPVPADAFYATSTNPIGSGYAEDAGAAGYNIVYQTSASSTACQLYTMKTDATYGNSSTVVSNTVPFTWGTLDYFAAPFAYKAA